MKKTTRLVTLSATAALLSGLFVQAEEPKNPKSVVSPPVSNSSNASDLFAAPLKPNPLAPKKLDLNAVAVRVNGTEIKQGEIIKRMQSTIRQLQARGISPQQLQSLQNKLYKNIENQIITQTLMDQEVKKANIPIDPVKLKEILAEIHANFEKSPEAKKGMTFEEALKKNGTTSEELTKDITKQLKMKAFIDKIVKNVKDVTEQDAKAYYDDNQDKFIQPEMVSASHILLKIDPTDDAAKKAEKKAKLEKIRKDIIAGTITFEDAAKKYSDCRSKKDGGSLGRPFTKKQMYPGFSVAAFTQEKGEIGEVVQSKAGYHIIKVTDHQAEKKVSFEEAKKQIIAYLTGKKKQQEMGKYIEGLRKAAKIEYIPVK